MQGVLDALEAVFGGRAHLHRAGVVRALRATGGLPPWRHGVRGTLAAPLTACTAVYAGSRAVALLHRGVPCCCSMLPKRLCDDAQSPCCMHEACTRARCIPYAGTVRGCQGLHQDAGHRAGLLTIWCPLIVCNGTCLQAITTTGTLARRVATG